jgi:hypothetical protein
LLKCSSLPSTPATGPPLLGISPSWALASSRSDSTCFSCCSTTSGTRTCPATKESTNLADSQRQCLAHQSPLPAMYWVLASSMSGSTYLSCCSTSSGTRTCLATKELTTKQTAFNAKRHRLDNHYSTNVLTKLLLGISYPLGSLSVLHVAVLGHAKVSDHGLKS